MSIERAQLQKMWVKEIALDLMEDTIKADAFVAQYFTEHPAEEYVSHTTSEVAAEVLSWEEKHPSTNHQK